MLAVLGVADLLKCLLRAGLGGLRQGVRNIGDLVNPAPLMAGLREHFGQGPPEAQGAVADREDRSTHAPACAVPQQVGPGVGGLAIAVCHGAQLFGSVCAHTDGHPITLAC